MKVILLFILSFNSYANLCQTWSSIKTIGTLQSKYINESSGIAFSSIHSNLIYHINDSGDGGKFYTSSLDGKKIETFKITGFKAKDFEDIDVGPCPSSGQCLFLGDIGDNAKLRRSINLVVVEEDKIRGESVKADLILELKYPDGAHNAEGIGVHPITGDLYIFTKEQKLFGKTGASKIYKLEQSKFNYGKAQTLKYIGQVDIPKILKKHSPKGQLVTAMDIHPDGKKFILLTYDLAIEVDLDLSHNDIPSFKNLDYTLINIKKLKQQEAISYTSSGDSFIYTTESKKSNSPILESHCL